MSEAPLHVAVVNWVWLAEQDRPEALLDAWPDLRGLVSGLLAAGAQVTLVQRFRTDAAWSQDGAAWRFVADGGPGRPARGDRYPRLARVVAELRPDVVHTHGLLFYPQIAALRNALPRTATLLAQHHAEAPAGRRRWFQAWALRRLDGACFASAALGEFWRQAGALSRRVPVYEVMEGSCLFQPSARDVAREASGLGGDPAFLWVGRLDQNKDPLCMLAGLRPILAARPQAELHMLYTDAPLLADVEQAVAADPVLSRQVNLVGSRPRAEMEAVYGSCDYYVSASHREGSGYALMEAMACGLVPIVTDIPSFRSMIGTAGALWQAGQPASLTTAAERILALDWPESSRQARQRFEDKLSWPAIGRDLVAAYREACSRRRAR